VAKAKQGGEGRGYGNGSKWKLPSGSWRVQFYLDGRTYRETHPTTEAADARLEEIQQLKAAKYDVARGLQTVSEFLTAWLSQRERSARAERTLDADGRNVDAYILPRLGGERLADVRANDLIDLLNGIQDDISTRTNGRFSGTRTAQLVASLLTQAFDAAVKQRLIPFSPMDGVEVPTYDRAEVEPADHQQIGALLARAPESPVPALWYLYTLLGLRRGEGIGIRISDVHLTQRTIMISQQVQAVGGELKIVRPKGKKSRLLPLALVAVPWVEQRITQVRAMRLKAGPAWQDHDLLFCTPDGRPIWPTTIDGWWRDLRDAAKLPAHLTLHSLRHSFATMLDECIVTEATKQRIMGHAKKNITQRYTHPAVETMRQAIEEVAGRVAPAIEKAQAQAKGAV
jgi:integrase